MSIDYATTERIVDLSFGRLDKPGAKLTIPDPGSLSYNINMLLGGGGIAPPILPYEHGALFASAGVEMWHRAIHSFLLSVALTKSSPIWASVTGYYSSHYVMRAFAHSMGIFKSFLKNELIQISLDKGQLVCIPISIGNNSTGEHAFYWKAVKKHPKFVGNSLFQENSEKNMKSESSHRTYANYIDHINSFVPMELPDIDRVADVVGRISKIRLHSIEPPTRDDYPDLQNVQILAFQRIVAFQDFLDERVQNNRFWKAHRRPSWCKDVMRFEVEEQGMEAPQLT